MHFFYYHDKNIIAGAAYETAVVGSNKDERKPGSQTGTGDKSGTDAAELEITFSKSREWKVYPIIYNPGTGYGGRR